MILHWTAFGAWVLVGCISFGSCLCTTRRSVELQKHITVGQQKASEAFHEYDMNRNAVPAIPAAAQAPGGFDFSQLGRSIVDAPAAPVAVPVKAVPLKAPPAAAAVPAKAAVAPVTTAPLKTPPPGFGTLAAAPAVQTPTGESCVDWQLREDGLLILKQLRPHKAPAVLGAVLSSLEYILSSRRSFLALRCHILTDATSFSLQAM